MTADDAEDELLERVTFGIDRMPLSDFADADMANSHLLFGSNVFQLRGESIRIPDHALAPTFGGLVSPSRRVFELADPPRVISYTLVPRPAKWESPVDDNLAASIHGILFGLQSAAAATVDRPTASQTHGRALVAEVDAAMSRVIERMHDVSEWVYLMDSHVDVEYFDQPSLEERYVIDYVPRILAGTGPGRRHNYVISTKRDAVMRAAINRFLHAAYPNEDVPADGAQRLSEGLNRLSGRLLLQLVRNPSLAKGAVGMGLLQLLAQTLRLLHPAPPAAMRALVPIDDYAAVWTSELVSLQGDTARDRADVLDVLVERSIVDGTPRIRLTLQVIEIKNVRR